MMISLCFSGPLDRMAKSAPTCGREFHHQCWRDPWQHLMHVWCTCDARVMHVWCTCDARVMHVWCTCDARVMHVMGGLCRRFVALSCFFQSADQLLTCLLHLTAIYCHCVALCGCMCVCVSDLTLDVWLQSIEQLCSYAFWDGANWGFQNLIHLMFISQASRGWWAAGPTDVTRPDTAVEWANGVSATYTICYVFLGLPDDSWASLLCNLPSTVS